MVDALREIHRALRPDGVLLDVHPQPADNRIEVRVGEQTHDLGEIDQSEDSLEIEAARSRLESILGEGLFAAEESIQFELREHHDSVSSWQQKWADEDYRLVAPPGMLERADELLSSGGELVIREQVRATRLRRLGN